MLIKYLVYFNKQIQLSDFFSLLIPSGQNQCPLSKSPVSHGYTLYPLFKRQTVGKTLEHVKEKVKGEAPQRGKGVGSALDSGTPKEETGSVTYQLWDMGQAI